MAIELPKASKVYTTTYDNFKGVDFTNDSTNVWRRRSPSAVNMLPDESGRPFKRHGWSILLSNADLCDALSEFTYGEVALTQEEFDADKTKFFILDDGEYVRCTDSSEYDEEETYYVRVYPQGDDALLITKCAYFELAGVDHIVVFTNKGVVFYNGEVTATNKEYNCYTGYDRSFFFEGDGTSAFYIYGDFQVWRYEADFALHDVTSIITVPTVLISTSADGVGTFYSGYNLLGTKASIEYCDTSLFTWWASDGLLVSVADTFKTAYTVNAQPLYRWKYSSGSWTTVSGGVAFPTSLITVSGTPKNDDEIIVLWIHGVLLPNNVSQDALTNTQVKVLASKTVQYDYNVPVYAYNTTLATGQCALFTDTTEHRSQKRAWIKFYDAWTEKVAGEDFVKVEFPTVNIEITQYTNQTGSGTANLVGA